MNHFFTRAFALIFLFTCLSLQASATVTTETATDSISTQLGENNQEDSLKLIDSHNHSSAEKHDAHHNEEGHDASHPDPAAWSVIPFVLLLLMIATGPLFYARFWHKYYPIISVVLATVVVIYYLAVLQNQHNPVHALSEYVSFIALIAALFISAGGILIKIDREGTPMLNVIILITGAVIANVIGTTGASMLLIFPFIRLNRYRIKPYHIVFFIFMVSNVGGALTPIGDPPLFLGFLKGVPFFWTLTTILPIWAFGIALLAIMFYFVDKRNHSNTSQEVEKTYTNKIQMKGSRNLIFLGITIAAVFIDPNVMSWVPYIDYHGDKISFLREAIMILTAILAFKTANEECLKGNEFSFEPVKEVGFLFVGIFATMMPALFLIGNFAKSSPELVDVNSLYWATGILSGVLDNAPTYLNFLAAGMGKAGLDIGIKQQVQEFVVLSSQYGNPSYDMLKAISVAAVFFGAFTYIGNAPNFMVKSIAEQVGIQMPSFVSYIAKYSLPILLPVLFLTWLLFFVIL